MIFQSWFEHDTSTYSYLLACERSRAAVIIDPVLSDLARYLQTLERLGLRLLYSLETHVHADHITAAAALRNATGSQSAVHHDGGAACADVLLNDGDVLTVGDLSIEVRHTPGHTAGCVSYVVEGRVFTGDALLIGGCGRTDFQQGDAGTLYDSIHRQLFSLPTETLVYPGHDYHGQTVSTIGHEIQHNARLGAGRSRADFIDLMQALNLPYPRYIEQAVPANRHCGQTAPQQG